VFLIVGLGNIGRKYVKTRHNVGFNTVDCMAEKLSSDWNSGKGEYYYASANFNQQEIILLKPTTYMNNSGIAVTEAMQTFSCSLSELMVVCDDFNLPLGKIRLRPKGSDGGHNGLSSIIYHLITDNFPRLRIGIGNDFGEQSVEEYVLSKFDKNERKIIDTSIVKAAEAVFSYIEEGIYNSMNKFN
jgi:peptidyl-tRNA hydrolase, PTH1 family